MTAPDLDARASGNSAYQALPIADVAQIAQNLARNCGYTVFPCSADKTPAWPKPLGGSGFKDASTVQVTRGCKPGWVHYAANEAEELQRAVL
jgi:hypothetical protein